MSSRKLTTGQQALLEEHLENTFREIERDYNKRTDPESAIPTVDLLLENRLAKLLRLILAIPSIPPTRHLQIAFLLRFTASAREWIAGYPLLWPSGYSPTSQGSTSDRESQAEATIRNLLGFLKQLDDGWQVVLVGRAREAGTSVPQDGRVTSAVLTATERVRLQSSIIAFRQTLLRWIARYKRASTGKNRLQGGSVANSKQSQEVEGGASESEAAASPRIVEATVDQEDSRSIDSKEAGKDDWPGDWEVAIANSFNGTLELMI